MWNVNDSVVLVEKVRCDDLRGRSKDGFVVRDLMTGKKLAPLFKGYAYETYAEALSWVQDMREVSGKKGLGTVSGRGGASLDEWANGGHAFGCPCGRCDGYGDPLPKHRPAGWKPW